ncbi:IucA/IucC family protein [Haloglycomyces albus]|uniref:IucA/IucC family protein n=1 Tax=Haloglycomyces albus TaxID=526067 RepID=UPI00046CA1CF|nr:IucA/IucC family protein [Haloglycomyces albus]
MERTTIDHLRPEYWEAETRRLLAKAIGEFSHERLLHPELSGDTYVVVGRRYRWTFQARRLPLDHWIVDGASLECRDREDGDECELSAAEFIVDLREALGLNDVVLPVYLEELASTLNRAVWQRAHGQPSASELAEGDFQTIEAAMTAGHPCFVAGSGRLGMSIDDYAAYAPETAASVRLEWVALRRDESLFVSTEGDTTTMAKEVTGPDWDWICERLDGLHLTVDDVHLIPVHPWQWRNKIAIAFAAEIATGRIVHLGQGSCSYQAQQSIRTFFNRTDPSQPYVKTAMSVLNMGFMRGLSTDYMELTPRINRFVADIVHTDPTLQESGVRVLREHSAGGYWHPIYTACAPKGSPYRKFLAALWRESPIPYLDDDEQPATMASLLHLDEQGRPLVSELVRRSGISARQWLREYTEAYLTPLVHCLYKYGLAFMPHGENVILVLRNGRVRRVFLKDIGEEITFLNGITTVPEDLERVTEQVSDAEFPLSILTDVVDCFLRFLAGIMDDDGILPWSAFWEVVADVLERYQRRHPELNNRFARWDLRADTFRLSCLNRLQLRDNTSLVDLENQSDSLVYAGDLDNPLAAEHSE